MLQAQGMRSTIARAFMSVLVVFTLIMYHSVMARATNYTRLLLVLCVLLWEFGFLFLLVWHILSLWFFEFLLVQRATIIINDCL
jgi:hypothetical protein